MSAHYVRDLKVSPHGDHDIQQQQQHEYTGGTARDVPGEYFPFSNFNALPFGTLPWDEDVQLVSPPESGPSTAPSSATPSRSRLRQLDPLSLPTSGLPDRVEPEVRTAAAATAATTSSLEERFAHVLRCARQVGFGDFDALALQYYARDDFAPGSDLALEQRRSRRRQLPGLLAELRARSTSWTDWQRRGYQEEMLRAAEELCAGECIALRRRLGVGDGDDGGEDENGSDSEEGEGEGEGGGAA
ncbi:hypothetical protein PG991_013987 [Apiospora marii]|uniref:Uncharacterized protein n=1 Tax=Apiospora marii TaxID=335849 RepID=A0ABR1R7H9_9PEZI